MNIALILIWTASIIWGGELLPQIKKTLKTKRVDDISLTFFVLCFLAYVLYISGLFLMKSYILIYAHIPSLITNMIMIVLILKYRTKKPNQLLTDDNKEYHPSIADYYC